MTSPEPTPKPPPIVRPNGKLYKPTKVIAYAWDNRDVTDDECGIVVLGTHDVDRARRLAESALDWPLGLGMPYYIATKADIGWFRQGYNSWGPAWISDEVRGRAGVMFWATDDDPEGE